MPVSKCGNRRHFRNQPVNLFPTRFFIEDVLGVGIERRKCAQRRDQNSHRMRVVMKAIHHLLNALVDEGVMGDVPGPVFQLSFSWQLAVQEQVSDLEIGTLLGQFFNRKSAVLENAFVAVDERDAAFARSGVHERRVVSHQAKVIVRDFDLAQVECFDRLVLDGNFVLLSRAIICDRQCVGGHPQRPLSS